MTLATWTVAYQYEMIDFLKSNAREEWKEKSIEHWYYATRSWLFLLENTIFE